jgi:hypothetical protein
VARLRRQKFRQTIQNPLRFFSLLVAVSPMPVTEPQGRTVDLVDLQAGLLCDSVDLGRQTMDELGPQLDRHRTGTVEGYLPRPDPSTDAIASF